MKVIHWDLLNTPESQTFFKNICSKHKGTALTIGGFDGPHLGHQVLFDSVLSVGAKSNLSCGVVTFVNSPGKIKNPNMYPGNVSTLTVRLAKMDELGFDFVLLIDFSGDFGRMAGGVFLEILVKTVCMRYLAVGPDFRCGHRLDTGTAEIAALARLEGFRFDSIPQIELDGCRISSSSIRKAIQNADFALAENLLGHPFLLDFTAPSWEIKDNSFIAPISSFTQIVPRRGNYSVLLLGISGKPVSATMQITEESVVLSPVSQSCLPEISQITTVSFRL